jgi:hypothetical protein
LSETGTASGPLAELERQARSIVDGVADSPEGRLDLRESFYLRYGCADRLKMDDKYGYGRSELDFMGWEIRRGVLDPVKPVGRGGSPWWRGVNGDFLYYGELGRLAHEAGFPVTSLPLPAARWADFIDQPSPKSWYRAHNTSIVHGYANRIAEAEAERRAEQIFLNEVLYRLLYAQGLVEGVEMGKLGEILAHPGLPSVDVLVHLPDFYPDDYPLDRADIRHINHKGHTIQEWGTRILDQILIHPHLTHLYEEASEWLTFHSLREYIQHGEPVYPALDPFSLTHHVYTRVARLVGQIWHWWNER